MKIFTAGALQSVIVGVLVACCSVFGLSGSALAATHNANFRGSWKSAAGGWVIRTENASTGVCTGTSDFGGAYKLTSCRVKGVRYIFTITRTGYKSYNSGTIHGNNVAGTFHDTNGTTNSYVATRA